MSYEVINEGMGFLNKLIEALEELEKENIYLEVDALDVPRTTDRHPYKEDDEVEDYSFGFIYMGEGFEVQAEYRNEFTLKVSLISKEKNFHQQQTFTMKEKTVTIKKMWKELLTKSETDLHLKPSSQHFFNIWYDWQQVGVQYYNDEKKKEFVNRLYQKIINFIDPSEIEKALEERYLIARNTSDLDIRKKVSQLTNVEFHQFLKGRLYIIYSNGDIFVLENEEEALRKYEEENIRRMKELVAEEIKDFKRIKAF